MVESVKRVRSALGYVAVLFGVEAVACLILPAEMWQSEMTGLRFLALVAAICTIAAGFGAFHASRSPGEASLVLALVLTTGSLLSAMILGLPGTGSFVAMSMAVLGYGSGVFLATAAWFASYSLYGTPPSSCGCRADQSSHPSPVDDTNRRIPGLPSIEV